VYGRIGKNFGEREEKAILHRQKFPMTPYSVQGRNEKEMVVPTSIQTTVWIFS
jgi:hypothetical protein